jgi:predicted ATPase
MESDFPEIVTTQPELLAHHHTEAGAVAQAIPYWEAAARRALQRYANQEAANHATRGLELVSALPDTPERANQELTLQLVVGSSVSFVQGPHFGEPNYTRARELARQVGSVPELFPALAGLAYANIVGGHMHSARSLSEEFLELARPHDDSVLLVVGHWLLAYTAWWQGDFVDVRTHSRQGLAFYDPNQHRVFAADYGQDPGLVCGYLEALSDWVLGYPAQAVVAMKETVTYARELENPGYLSMVLLMSAQLSQLRREPEPARVMAEEGLALGAEHGLHAVTLWCLLPRGWALAQQGDVAQGLSDITAAMDRRRAFGIGAVWPWFLALAAEAYGMLGQFDAAFSALDEAREWVQRNDERLYAAEVYRIHGELLLRKEVPDPAQAERCFHEAFAMARDHDAKSWELRAATSMARMWLADGRPDNARALLSPVYGWFTEGFDTADLTDAKALLDQMTGL